MKELRLRVGNQDLILQTGKLARQANGAVLAKYGGVVVLSTVCCSSKEGTPMGYVPLSVDYNEKYYAAGKIPGGFLKREGRPKDREILVSRLIDRPMRPLFYKEFGRDIQVIPTVISADQVYPPDVVGMIGAFSAVMVSDIPFNGPVAAVRVAYLGGNYIINPAFEQIVMSELDIVVAASRDGISMVEGGGSGVDEEIMLGAISRAEVELRRINDFLTEFSLLSGKKKLPIPEVKNNIKNVIEIRKCTEVELAEVCFLTGKQDRSDRIKNVKNGIREKFASSFDESEIEDFNALLDDVESCLVRKSILEKGKRIDGRGLVDIREISCEIDILPRVHGSSLFTRGETQSLSIVTLGTLFDEQILDNIDGDRRENFILHYNFPPFSVGEVGRLFTGRREIGHGYLAQRALEAVLPDRSNFGYTVRVVSEILESNGSSSQATVCAGSLSLLAAGVPIKAHVAGIAMGLVRDGSRYAVLSDILGEEDHLGDMDFKVAGTMSGITAFQMDIKCSGITIEIIRDALKQARDGRLHILKIMEECINKPVQISEFAPRVETFKVDIDRIGSVIGPGGRTIKAISEKFQAKINIDDDGTVSIFSKNNLLVDEAKKAVLMLISDPEIGHIYEGIVKRVMDFGAFIEIMTGKEGLCHISRISKNRVERVQDILSEGQKVRVQLVEIDKMGRLNFSMIDV